MNTMEITKIVGAVCGSLLVFLLLNFFAENIFDTASDKVAFSVEVAEASGAASASTPADAGVDVDALVASADAKAGATVFKRCAACHKVNGQNAVGPHLNGVVGRDKGSVDGFSYSAEMKGLGGQWTPADIFHFIANPKAFAPGTKMTFAGLPKPQDRADVIAYLETLGN